MPSPAHTANEFTHEFPTSINDWEYQLWTQEVTVYVSKVGGGTIDPPHSYTGHWHYAVYNGAECVMSGSDLSSGSPLTHDEAALLIRDYYFDDEL